MLCKYPLNLEKAGGIVRCGRCHHCRIDKRRKKTTRLLLESKQHEDILFITLTYSDEFLPREIFNADGEVLYENKNGCLDKRAIQLFFKRLRKRVQPRKLRFFAVGEYGEKKGRPHYHIILFGLPYSSRADIYRSWCDPVTGRIMCDPDRIDVQVPRNNWDVSQYACAYIVKKMTREDDPRLSGRPPEFFLSSKGIGSLSVEQLAQALSNKSAQSYIELVGDIPRYFVHNGKKLPIDRYMRGKLIDALQITEMAKKTGTEKYQSEMFALRERAQANTQIPRHWRDALKSIQPNAQEKRYASWALEKQFLYDHSQEMLSVERKGDLHKAKTGDF